MSAVLKTLSKRCTECGADIKNSDTYYEHRTGRVLICQACEDDWMFLGRVTHVPREYGALGKEMIAAHERGQFSLPFYIERVKRWRGIEDRRAEVRSRIVYLTDAPRKTPEEIHITSRNYSEADLKEWYALSIADLIAMFEDDILFGRGVNYLARYNHSDSCRFLRRRWKESLPVIVHYLNEIKKIETALELRQAWGRLLSQMQTHLDPEATHSPEMFDEIDGWILWAEQFLFAREHKAVE